MKEKNISTRLGPFNSYVPLVEKIISYRYGRSAGFGGRYNSDFFVKDAADISRKKKGKAIAISPMV